MIEVGTSLTYTDNGSCAVAQANQNFWDPRAHPEPDAGHPILPRSTGHDSDAPPDRYSPGVRVPFSPVVRLPEPGNPVRRLGVPLEAWLTEAPGASDCGGQ